MNWAAAHLPSRKELYGAAEKERFLKAEREQDKRELFQARSPP